MDSWTKNGFRVFLEEFEGSKEILGPPFFLSFGKLFDHLSDNFQEKQCLETLVRKPMVRRNISIKDTVQLRKKLLLQQIPKRWMTTYGIGNWIQWDIILGPWMIFKEF